MSITVAMIAHDTKKDDMVSLARRYRDVLARYDLVATGTTGDRIHQETGLTVERMLSGSMGGDIQVAARVIDRQMLAVIFLNDSINVKPQEPDIQALLRICDVHNVPLATNLATAELLLKQFARERIAHLIFNPVSGQGDAQQQILQIRRLLEPRMHLAVKLTTLEVGARELAEDAIAAGADLLIASGGDGTVSAVAGVAVETDIPMAVIPRGTANAFASALGIPMDLQRACEVILAGITAKIDVARCNGQPMVLLAGIGYEAAIVEKADRELKRRFGPLAYIFSGIQQLNEQEMFQTQLEIDGEIREFEAGAVTIANVAPPTSVLAQGFGRVIANDGLLDVTVTTAENMLQGVNTMLSLFGSALIQRAPEREGMVAIRAARLQVNTEPPQKVVLDGEIIGTTPVEFDCLASGLTVLLPQVPVEQVAPSQSQQNDTAD
ncbi:MAG: methylglyoxal synthase [Cyanobacteria bacterium P01_H01_bin.119]